MAEIVLDNISFNYAGSEEAVLTDFTLSIADGEGHALLGGSGAGKTTLLNLLSGLLKPTQGDICFDGQRVNELRGAARQVAQVFQFPVLYEGLSVMENLAFPLRNLGWDKISRRTRGVEVAKELDIEHLLERKPSNLSLYEKQFVAIGRALARPELALILLDEPLTAVEPSVKWRFRNALKRMQEKSGYTMVYVTHDQTEALTFADRTSVVAEGRIVETGTPFELVHEPQREFVAGFIGSPGMNLLAADVKGGEYRLGESVIVDAQDVADGSCTLGFRPEWGCIGNDEAGLNAVPVEVTGTRVTGSRGGALQGLVSAHLLSDQSLQLITRQTLDFSADLPLFLNLNRPPITFRDGSRVQAK